MDVDKSTEVSSDGDGDDDPYVQWYGYKTADVTDRTLWPREKLRNVSGVRCLAFDRDELVCRATARAALMDRTAVRRAIHERRGTRGLIVRFDGVDDVLVCLALTLEHMEQVVDDCEAKKGEGEQHTRNIRRLEELLRVAAS